MKKIKLLMLMVVAIITFASCQKEEICLCYSKYDVNKDSLIVIEGTHKYIEEVKIDNPDWICE